MSIERIRELTSKSVDRKLQEELNKLREVEAKRFGEGRGWKLSRGTFGLHAFKAGSRTARLKADYTGEDYPYSSVIDHPEYYKQYGCPIAIVSHTYGYDKKACDAFCDEYGLVHEKLDEPSWYYPGGTTSIVFTRKEPIK